jgi:radical SAM superfamily enzyme YgiQ (UPF0313 family)
LRILLIQLYSGKECKPIYPLGLSYLSSVLPKHDVAIFDQNLCDNDPFSETENIVSDFSPAVVGISIRNIHIYSNTTGFFNADTSLRLTIDAIKKVSDRICIIAGGPGFSMFPVRFMQNEPRINFGIFLEGEESFPQLLENLDCPEKVKAVYWRNKGEILFSDGYIPPKFETLSEPRRDIADPRKYKGEYAIGIQTKRGCALRCLYCVYVFLGGNGLRMRPPEDVVDEIEELVNNHGAREFSFVDHVFNIPKTHAEQICEEILRRNIQVQWSAWFNEKFMDEQFIDLAIKAGCRLFEFSPDGYSNRSLRWLKKNIQTKDITNTYRLVRKKHQVNVGYNFIRGIPGQNIFSLAGQLFFFLKLKVFLRKRLKIITFNKLGIDPNTELEKIALKEGIITPETDLFNPTFYQVGIVQWISKYKGVISVFKFLKKTLLCRS